MPTIKTLPVGRCFVVKKGHLKQSATHKAHVFLEAGGEKAQGSLRHSLEP